jgi:Skp family chaperone for outer membrane proteins
LENTPEYDLSDSENDERTQKKEKSRSTSTMSQGDYEKEVAKRVARNEKMLLDVMKRAKETQDVNGKPGRHEDDELESSPSE